MFRSATLLAVLLAWATSAAAVTAVPDPGTGLVWRQLTDTATATGISWDQVAAACPGTGGECSGKVGDVDYAGWTWAAIADVNRLFSDFKIPGFDTAAPSSTNEKDSKWAPAFLASFTPTAKSATQALVQGWARDQNPPDRKGALPYVLDLVDPQSQDEASTKQFLSNTTRYAEVGAWLYRQDPAAIPEPSTYALMLAGLGVLGFAARRRAR